MCRGPDARAARDQIVGSWRAQNGITMVVTGDDAFTGRYGADNRGCFKEGEVSWAGATRTPGTDRFYTMDVTWKRTTDCQVIGTDSGEIEITSPTQMVTRTCDPINGTTCENWTWERIGSPPPIELPTEIAGLWEFDGNSNRLRIGVIDDDLIGGVWDRVDGCPQLLDEATLAIDGFDDQGRWVGKMVSYSGECTPSSSTSTVFTVSADGSELSICVGGLSCVSLHRVSAAAAVTRDARYERSLDTARHIKDLINAFSKGSGGDKAAENLTLFLATGEQFPDGLAVAGASGKSRGLTLLVDPADGEGNRQRIYELIDGVTNIVIAGGTGAVPDSAVPTSSEPGIPTVRRIGGASRYETAALISQAFFTSPAAEVFIATGRNFPDALAGGAAASDRGAPVLLVDGGTMPAATDAELRRLAPGRIWVLGGPAVVPDSMVTMLGGYTPGQVQRLAGTDRFGTSAEVSRILFPTGANIVTVVPGADFPDALMASSGGWVTDGPVLLTPAEQLAPTVSTELSRLNPASGLIVGSFDGVQGTTRREIEAILAS